MDLSAFLGEYRAEAGEHLRRLDSHLLALERDPADGGAVREMFLSAHTIKGGASMLGLGEVRELAHALEDVLACLRDRGEPLDRATADLLFRAIDALRALVERSATGPARQDAAGAEIITALRRRAADGSAPTAASAAPAPMGQCRALLIEDSATVRLLECSLLTEAGFEVDETDNGERAVDLARSGAYMLLVAGREVAGPNLLAEVRATAPNANLPVIVTSSAESAESALRVVEPGREVHIPKGSLGRHRLIEAVRTLLPEAPPARATRGQRTRRVNS